MTLNQLMTTLAAELAEGGVPDPLQQRFRLDFVWIDLCRLAGEPLPAEIAGVLDRPVCLPVDLSLRNENLPAFLAD